MQLTEEQFRKIEARFLMPRGNVKIDDRAVMNAVLLVECGPGHTVYMCWDRWCKQNVMTRVFKALQDEGIIPVSAAAGSLDSSSVVVQKHGTDVPKTRSAAHRQ